VALPFLLLVLVECLQDEIAHAVCAQTSAIGRGNAYTSSVA
jgi:hypothetical protein